MTASQPHTVVLVGNIILLQLCVLWFNFILGSNFILFCFCFLGIVMYDNEFETKELKFEPRIKLNHNICNELFVPG